MPDTVHTTGELAKLCDVTVRTVQYYDTQNLLKPSALSEGGRRLYTQADLERLQLICLLRSLDLPVPTIRDLLAQEHPEKTLDLLLTEQSARINERMDADKHQLEVIAEVQRNLNEQGRLPQSTRRGIENDMEGRERLRRFRRIMLGVGIAVDLVEYASLIYGIVTHVWWPFFAVMVAVIPICIVVVRLYYRETAYICPECGGKFKPAKRDFMFSKHTPKLRKLTCPNCGFKGYCVETYADLPTAGKQEVAS